MSYLPSILFILVGFTALLVSADRFVAGASSFATRFGISPMIIGLTVVALGTSSPEIVVSLVSSYQGYGDLAIGNAIGSNIANTSLVIGVAAVIAPITVKSKIIQQEFPMLFIVMLFTGVLLQDGMLTRMEGVLLFIGLVMTLQWIVRAATLELSAPHGQDPLAIKHHDEAPNTGKTMSIKLSITLMIVSLFIMVASSRVIVMAATDIASALGVSQVVIGLTIVALGTSLPEVATTAVSAFKGEHDMAVGGVIGSNVFNLLAVLGVAPMVGAISVPSEILSRDFVVMSVVTILLFLMAIGWNRKGVDGRINRKEGALLLGVFTAYTITLFIW